MTGPLPPPGSLSRSKSKKKGGGWKNLFSSTKDTTPVSGRGTNRAKGSAPLPGTSLFKDMFSCAVSQPCRTGMYPRRNRPTMVRLNAIPEPQGLRFPTGSIRLSSHSRPAFEPLKLKLAYQLAYLEPQPGSPSGPGGGMPLQGPLSPPRRGSKPLPPKPQVRALTHVEN